MQSLQLINFTEPYLYLPKNRDTKKEWDGNLLRIPGTTHCNNISCRSCFQQFKERFRMNRIQNANERYFFGKEAAKWMNEKLKAGFNPFEAINLKSQSAATSGRSLPPILQQLETVKNEETKGATDSKKASYREQYNRFKKFIEEEGMEQTSMHEFTQDHADEYADYLKEQKLAVKTVNQALGYMQKMWKLAGKKKWCTKNVFEDVDRGFHFL
jgi:hypothetical protein